MDKEWKITQQLQEELWTPIKVGSEMPRTTFFMSVTFYVSAVCA